MGATYANVTVVGTTGPAVVDALGDEPAFVADAGDGTVVVFAEADEDGGFSAGITARLLSAAVAAPALEVSVFDEDLLQYQVCVGGETVTDGLSPIEVAEEMIGPGEVMPATDPERLVAVLGRGDPAAVRRVLNADMVFATDRHAQFATALGLPDWAAARGFRYLDDGEDELPVPVVRTGT
jgi:hypothetical protein